MGVRAAPAGDRVASPVAKARQIQIGAALQGAQVIGDRVLLERLVSNLIETENAVRQT